MQDRSRRRREFHHCELIACIKAQDVEGAAQAIAKHVGGSGHHIIERMRVSRHAMPGLG
ncbi:DNA-binding GntR family transcriptional regulator [Rhizobium sp. BK316]|uniref:hypothetical protein n=1 Tax=Rhizobium sp. BK316 TaxID=2587053 RepID=UPI0018367F4D|nr:hypothetical protein [Rhizobium sp. BK316]MBB3406486.1 DNA-binding GntR family transcriptional regulator [Rhizobium sp. BK316]